MSLDGTLHDGEAEPGALWFGRGERREQSVANLFRNTRALVANANLDGALTEARVAGDAFQRAPSNGLTMSCPAETT